MPKKKSTSTSQSPGLISKSFAPTWNLLKNISLYAKMGKSGSNKSTIHDIALVGRSTSIPKIQKWITNFSRLLRTVLLSKLPTLPVNNKRLFPIFCCSMLLLWLWVLNPHQPCWGCCLRCHCPSCQPYWWTTRVYFQSFVHGNWNRWWWVTFRISWNITKMLKTVQFLCTDHVIIKV